MMMSKVKRWMRDMNKVDYVTHCNGVPISSTKLETLIKVVLLFLGLVVHPILLFTVFK
nr:MAG TPA: hypothetical protein [Caudoviricetes sp.]